MLAIRLGHSYTAPRCSAWQSYVSLTELAFYFNQLQTAGVHLKRNISKYIDFSPFTTKSRTLKRPNAVTFCRIVEQRSNAYLSRSDSRSKEADKGRSRLLIGPTHALHIPSCLSARTEVGLVSLSRSVGQTENNTWKQLVPRYYYTFVGCYLPVDMCVMN